MIRSLFLGSTRTKAQLATAETEFHDADERLRAMEAHREHMRRQLEEALRQIIQEKES